MSQPVPTQQKALWVPAPHADFTVGPAEVPKPGPGEVLVRAEAVGLNPIDWIVQLTNFFSPEYPLILGWEAAGVVVQLGEGVDSFAVGDKVMHPGLISNKSTTFKQYNVVPAYVTAKVPSNLTIDQAAAIPLALNTAAFGLYAKPGERGGAGLLPPWAPGGRGKYAGQPIFVISGASSVGQLAIQFAKLSGFSPIIATASLKNAEYLKSLGATHVIDRNVSWENLPAAVKEITKEPLPIIYDALSNKESENTAYDMLDEDGTVVIVTGVFIPESKRTPGKHTADINSDPYWPGRKEIATELYSHITALFASGDLKPNRVEVVPGGLGGVPAGLKKLKDGQVSALKLVAHPQEEA